MIGRIPRLLIAVFAACFSVGAVACSAVELIQNGDFEELFGGLSTGIYLVNPTYQYTEIPRWTALYDPNIDPFAIHFGWVVVGDYENMVVGGPVDGRVYLNPTRSGKGVMQTFSVTAGTTYNLSFYAGRRGLHNDQEYDGTMPYQYQETFWDASYDNGNGTFGAWLPTGNSPTIYPKVDIDVTLTATAGTLSGANGTLSLGGSGSSVLSGATLATQSGYWTHYTCSFTPDTAGDVTLKFLNQVFPLPSPGPDGIMYGIAVGNGTFLDAVSVTGDATPPRHPGDANGDNKVDVVDLGRVLTNYNKSGLQWSDGDFNADGMADINDLTNVLTNYDKTFTAVRVTPAPEPAGLVLLGMGTIGLLANRLSRRSRGVPATRQTSG